jgi:hypothetical protein
MRKTFLSASALLCASLLLTGCGAQGGRTIMTQGGNAEPVLSKAPESGTYKLYTAMSPNPTLTVNLREGDQLGWRKNANGRFEAVAGEQSEEMSGFSQAYWKLDEPKKK